MRIYPASHSFADKSYPYRSHSPNSAADSQNI